MTEFGEKIGIGDIEVVDTVQFEHLPKIPYFAPLNDRFAIADLGDRGLIGRKLPSETIDRLGPSPTIVSMEDVGIDFELLASDARTQEADKFRRIIRMGGAFDYYKDGYNDHEVEDFAVSVMGLDASLYFHGIEQARRMNNLMLVQQIALRRAFNDIRLTLGDRAGTIDSYNKISEQIPDFTPRDVKYGVLCGLLHDYGEAKLGRDIPFELKNNPAYVKLEAAEAVEFAKEIHFPKQPPELVDKIRQRVVSEHELDFVQPANGKDVNYYLDPCEITTAIFGTEKLDHGDVARGEAFAAVERLEYVLSGIRAFEAVEHNYKGVRQDEVLTQNLLRLGVSTFFNSLEKLAKYSEKYVAVYDFIAQNQATIDRYMGIVMDGIEKIAEGNTKDRKDIEIFGMDPFANYDVNDGDIIDIDEARKRFTATSEFWAEWKNKQHTSRILWENYFGTTHHLTKNNPDVTFLQQTARMRAMAAKQAGRVLVQRHLKDMFGVGLDHDSQEKHEELVVLAA